MSFKTLLGWAGKIFTFYAMASLGLDLTEKAVDAFAHFFDSVDKS